MSATIATATVDSANKDQVHKAFRHVAKWDAPTQIATAGAATYTAAQILAGIVLRDPAGAGRTDVLPTAALLVGALRGEEIGDVIKFVLCNQADANETITLTAGSGGAFDTGVTSTQKTVVQDAKKEVYIRLTGVVAGSEAYVVYM